MLTLFYLILSNPLYFSAIDRDEVIPLFGRMISAESFVVLMVINDLCEIQNPKRSCLDLCVKAN